MSLKSRLGLDGFDLALQAAITVVLLAWIGATNNEHDAQIGAGFVTTASLVVLGVRRHLALRRQNRVGLITGETSGDRLAELEHRVEDVEAMQSRILELEERLDFAERLLAAPPSEAAGRLDPNGGSHGGR